MREPQEERSARRVRSKGSVRISDGVREVHGRIDDLSTVGARIATDEAWPLNHDVALEFHFDVLPQTLSTRGHVTRWSEPDHRLAVAFDDIDGTLSAYVLDELDAAACDDSQTNLLLVEGACATRDSIAASFREH